MARKSITFRRLCRQKVIFTQQYGERETYQITYDLNGGSMKSGGEESDDLQRGHHRI